MYSVRLRKTLFTTWSSSQEIAEISVPMVIMNYYRVCGFFYTLDLLNFPAVLNQVKVGSQRQCLIRGHVSSLALFSNVSVT